MIASSVRVLLARRVPIENGRNRRNCGFLLGSVFKIIWVVDQDDATPGQRHDSVCARPLPERIHGPRTGPGLPWCRPRQVIADEAYGSRGLHAYLRKRGIAHKILRRSTRNGTGRTARSVDRETYRHRNLIEIAEAMLSAHASHRTRRRAALRP
ncbi:transposase [Streptomyces sp. NPDC126514]|uniref:transposase n=1 Tax=Streptomyces sp. NPDC126514 TaxID=3155210 RepID=UPI003332A63D